VSETYQKLGKKVDAESPKEKPIVLVIEEEPDTKFD